MKLIIFFILTASATARFILNSSLQIHFNATEFEGMPIRHSEAGEYDYYISIRFMRQSEAMLACSQNPNFQLAAITTQAENDLVEQVLTSQYIASVWTSGTTNEFFRQNYRWMSTKKLIHWTNWAPGQPFDFKRGFKKWDWSPFGIIINRHSGFKWELKFEHSLYPAICQRKIFT